MKKRVDIKIGYQCNNHCKFCVQGDKRDCCRDKTTQEIKVILKNSKADYQEVIFTGGEATIRPDIVELVSCSRNLGYKVHIQTNGRMFAYNDFCKMMVSKGAELFTIAIHGHNPQLHDYLTGAKGSFNQTLSGIKNLLSMGCLVFTNTVITRQNYRYLPEISDFLMGLGIYEYKLTFPHIMGSAFKNRKSIIPRKSVVSAYVRKSLEIGLKKKRRPLTEAIPFCFLGPYIDCAIENFEHEVKVFDTHLTEDFNLWRKEEGTLKADKCNRCRYFERCDGPWREYPQLYGWSEFKPVR